MGNSLEQWRSSIGSFASKIGSNSWTKNCSTGASAVRTARARKLSEMQVVRRIREEAWSAFSWTNFLFATFVILAVMGVLAWGSTITKTLVLLNLPGAGRLLYVSLKKLQDYLFKYELELWSVATEILENISLIVMIQFTFIDMPKEFMENFTCKITDFQCGAGGCEAGWGVNDLNGICEFFTRQLIGLLLVMAGDVETNPGPPTTLMEGLAALIAEAPINLKPIISKWNPKNDATKNKKEINNATNANEARELLAYLWNATIDDAAVKVLTKKEDVVYQAVIALENLLPETCDKCKSIYSVKRDDTPTLRCALCKQGFHEACLSPEIKGSMAGIWAYMPGKFKWLCPGCDKHLCSSSTVVGRKRDVVAEPPQVNPQPAGETPEEHPLTAPPPAPSPPPPVPLRLMIRPTGEGTLEAFTAPVTDDDRDDGPDVQVNDDTVEEINREVTNGNDIAGPERPVCGYFLKGECRHGFVGRGCKDRHPKYCPAFRKWGTAGDSGCKRGKRCEFGSHPVMCSDSVSRLRCENPDCSAKLHAIKCIRSKRNGANVNRSRGVWTDQQRQETGGVRPTGNSRGAVGWPRNRSVWESQQRGTPSDRTSDQDSDFRERHQTLQPPTEAWSQLRQEMLAQQQQFQRQMMTQIGQMIQMRMAGGDGRWPHDKTRYNY